MDEIESLCRLCEAVETAGADIAPRSEERRVGKEC